MRIPVYLAVAQWTLLLALAFLVIIMYRQLGRVFSQNKHTHQHGPATGSGAASFEYMRAADGTRQYLNPGDGQPTLLAFVDPSCRSCEQLVDAMGVAKAAGELDGLRVLLLMSDPPAYLQISETFRSTKLEIGRIMTPTTQQAYNALATPLLVAIDPAGVIRSAGVARELPEVRAFSLACLRPPLDLKLAATSAASESTESSGSATAAARSE